MTTQQKQLEVGVRYRQVLALNEQGLNDIAIGLELGITRQRVSQLRKRNDIPIAVRIRHKRCVDCGAQFTQMPGEKGRRRCADHRRPSAILIECQCAYCGTRFMRKESELKRATRYYCSRECFGRFKFGRPRSGSTYLRCTNCGDGYYGVSDSLRILCRRCRPSVMARIRYRQEKESAI
jgi:hypothetical protein